MSYKTQSSQLKSKQEKRGPTVIKLPEGWTWDDIDTIIVIKEKQ